jgi:hypothetical protein
MHLYKLCILVNTNIILFTSFKYFKYFYLIKYIRKLYASTWIYVYFFHFKNLKTIFPLVPRTRRITTVSHPSIQSRQSPNTVQSSISECFSPSSLFPLTRLLPYLISYHIPPLHVQLTQTNDRLGSCLDPSKRSSYAFFVLHTVIRV